MKNITKRIPFFWNMVCGVATLLSLGLAIWGNSHAVIIVLSFFCVSLLVLLIVLLKAINSYLKSSRDSDYIRIYTDVKYETTDGYHIDYSNYRIVQSKCILLQKIEHGFKWSGTQRPKISSDLQDVLGVNMGKDNEYDTVTLGFQSPLLYNETAVVHFRAEIDDSDEKSEPMISYKVSTYSELIHFRVVLKHKGNDYNKKAKVFIRPINSSTMCREKEIATIIFDKNTKSYEYIKERPDIGYFYILRWER